MTIDAVTLRALKISAFSLLMLACASGANAVMDVLSSRYSVSVFFTNGSSRRWLDPQLSWKNKWKNGDRSQGEAFPLSATSLVATTDAWHFFKFLTILFISLAVIAPFTAIFKLHWTRWVLVLFGLSLLHGLVFESLYSHLLIK